MNRLYDIVLACPDAVPPEALQSHVIREIQTVLGSAAENQAGGDAVRALLTAAPNLRRVITPAQPGPGGQVITIMNNVEEIT